MKKLRLLILAPLALLGLAMLSVGAQTTYTKQTVRVARLQTDPTYNAAGTVTAVTLEYFIRVFAINGTEADVMEKPQVRVAVDLLDAARASDVITAAGKTVSPPQLAALLRQYGIDRANAQGL